MACELFAQGGSILRACTRCIHSPLANPSKVRLKVASLGHASRRLKPHRRRSLLSALQTFYQSARGQQALYCLSQESAGQRAAIRFGLPHATTLCQASITVNRQLDLRELEGANDVFDFGRESRVVKPHQLYEFTLQGDKSLDGNRTQGSIHEGASSS